MSTSLDARVEAARRPDVEAWLDGLGVKWAYEPRLPLSKIDEKESLSNQARFEPLVQEVVDRYTEDVRRGHQFPPVLANQRGRRRTVSLLGGNHRLMAHKYGGAETIPAYVVSVEPEMAVRMTYEDNRRHGLPPSEDERILQAIHLIENGWTQERAAACVGVSAPRISSMRTAINAKRRAKELGVDDGFDSLPAAHKISLGRLRSDPVFLEAANLTVQAKLSVDEVKVLCGRLQEARSDADALSLLGMEQEELQARIQRSGGGRVRAQRTPRAVYVTAMRELRDRDPEAVLSSIPNAEARAKLRKEVAATIEHLEAVQRVLK